MTHYEDWLITRIFFCIFWSIRQQGFVGTTANVQSAMILWLFLSSNSHQNIRHLASSCNTSQQDFYIDNSDSIRREIPHPWDLLVSDMPTISSVLNCVYPGSNRPLESLSRTHQSRRSFAENRSMTSENLKFLYLFYSTARIWIPQHESESEREISACFQRSRICIQQDPAATIKASNALDHDQGCGFPSKRYKFIHLCH